MKQVTLIQYQLFSSEVTVTEIRGGAENDSGI